MVRCRAIASNLTIVAVLVVTVTFAAAFILPGGYRSDAGLDQGMATLAKRAAFKAFLVSDATAMVSSIIVVHSLIHAGSLDHDVRLHSIATSMNMLQAALVGMVVAFATGVYVTIEAECRWLAILICAVVCSIPFWMHTPWPTFDLFKLVRTGIRGKIMVSPSRGEKSHGNERCYTEAFVEEGRINVPGLLQILGYHRTIDFSSPSNSEQLSSRSQIVGLRAASNSEQRPRRSSLNGA